MTRLLLALTIALAIVEPARADTIDLHQLYDRASAFVTSLVDDKPDPDVIAPPGNIDRGMVVAPPRTGPIRNILPRDDGPLRPD